MPVRDLFEIDNDGQRGFMYVFNESATAGFEGFKDFYKDAYRGIVEPEVGLPDRFFGGLCMLTSPLVAPMAGLYFALEEVSFSMDALEVSVSQRKFAEEQKNESPATLDLDI